MAERIAYYPGCTANYVDPEIGRSTFAVLEKHGFRTRQNRDNVAARIEGYEKDVMLTKLEVLGYLMFHTRQLDMVMDDENAIRQYKQKIFDDLEKLSVGEV